VKPTLASYAFPGHILSEAILAAALDEARLGRIRESVRRPNVPGSMIAYRTRYFDESAIERDSIDLLCSQAVLEHVDDLVGSYRAMRLWLKPGGVISHVIDFRCHSTARDWNGHWEYSDRIWKIIRGKRSYLLNREPYSRHLQLMSESGFALAGCRKDRLESRLAKSDLAPRFQQITDEDLTTCTAHLLAVKTPVA
jgi:SAM-dependent methyltransferase